MLRKLPRKVFVCLFALATLSTCTRAQTPTTPASLDAQINLLFERSHAFFQKADALCDVASCHNAVAAADATIHDGANLKETQQFYGYTRADWHKTFDAQIQTVQIEMINIVRRKQGLKPIRYIESLSKKPCLKTVDAVGCNEVFAAATAICGLYTLAPGAGPYAAAICEAAAIYGYNKCLQQAYTPAP